MEDFKFSPVEQDDSDFSFTPDETQPDFSKVSGTDFIGEKGVNDNTLDKLKNFWNNITTFEVREATPTERTEALDKVVEQVKSGEFNPKELLTESTKSLTRETLSLGKGLTGDALKILGDQLYDYRDLSELNMIDKFDAKMNNVLAGGLIKLGDTINGYIDAGIESELLRPDEEVFKGDFVENPSLTRAVSLAMGVIPSLTYGGLISKATKSTTFGGLALSALDAEDIYFGSREAGKSQKEALTLFGVGTAGTAILEKAGLDAVFDKKMTSLSKSILKSMATEGFTEGTQTVFQNAVKKYGYDESQELLEGAVESIIAGSLGAGIVSTARGGYYKYKNKAKELGINEQESDSLIETVGYEMNQKPEAINALFQDNLNKSLNTLSEKLKTLPEEQKTRITTELNSIYDKTYKDLSKYMPEEQAKSNAALVRNSSFFFADVLGISPQQYMDRYGTKVVKQQFQDFEKRNKPSEYPLDVLVQDIARLKKGVSRKTDKGLRLSQFIKQKGGIKDDRGDIKSMGASVGLLNKNGISLDEATRMAWDAGYIQGTERPEINQLLDLLSDDLGNRPVYAFDDQFNGNDRQYYLELERALDEAGADINKDSIETIKKKLDDYSLRINKEPELPAYNPELDDFIPFQESLSLAKENARLDDIYPAYEGETITINGKERTVYNSNGDRIAKSKEALENFYKWFGDSKVVDEQGRPLVVYHGTKSKFNVFDKSKKGQASTVSKAGFWFSPSEEFGKNFAEDIWYGEEETIVMPVYLNLQNPKIYKSGKISEEEYEKAKRIFENAENKLKEAEDETQRILEKDGLLASWQYRDKINIDKIRKDFEYAKSELNATQTTDAYEKFKMDIYRVGGQKPTEATVGGLGMALDDYKSPEKYADMLKEQGYDGIIIEDTVYDASNITNAKTNTQYVAFESNQIKSTSNRGTYSESENIYYQFAGERAKTAALDSLRLAQNMEINDYSTDEIWRETGWYKGKDGKWRFEISDDDAVVDLSKTATDAGTTLGNILSHDKLYSAYPELRGLSVIVSSEMKGGRAGAHYLKGVYDKNLDMTIGKRIEINSDIIHRKDVDLKSIIMHEVQHAIQDIEGFASGGSVSTFFDKENMDVFQKLFQEEDNKKFNQAVLDALYGEVSTDAANKISDADDKVVAAAEKFALAEGDGIEEAQVYDDALEELDNALKEVGKSSDWFAELKTKAREKAGIDIMGRSKRAKNYDPFELYKQLYGEVEARNTQARMDLNEKERRAKTPESTQDVANADAIVVFDDGTAMAYAPEASGNIYLQSAFAGSRVDYDRPSLEAIGSGEGNQAHGWGLYYALDRDVAEGYKDRFTAYKNNIAFNDKTYTYGEDSEYVVLQELKDKEKTIEQLKEEYTESVKDLNEYAKEAEEAKDKYWSKEWKRQADDAEKVLNFLNTITESDIKNIKTVGGQVHEVDIPENPYLLDEQKPFSEQSDIVKKGIENAVKEIAGEDSQKQMEILREKDFLGREIYNTLSRGLSSDENGKATGRSDKAASHLLEKYGIKGITYDGKQDGRCFVIFNPADVKVIQKFYQGEQSPQGAFANDTIYLFENADESTFAHELSHSWKKQLRNIYEETQSERVKGILDSVDSWTDSELQRKYDITKRENGYAVVDKRGRVVYDNRGVGFLSDYDAREYAKEELFARGFEQYLKEGKAPNKSLKQAFRNFFMWLKKIYRDAMDLNIQLSPDIKNVFSDILGGTDIDFFLESTPESFIQNRINLGKQREKYLDDIIDKAIANKQQVVKAQVGKKFGDIWTTAMIPLSTRAKRISPKVRNMLRRYEFDLSNELNKKYAQATPFMNIWKSMQEDDKIAFDYALKNDYVKKQLEIVDKYNARKEWESVRGLLEQIYDEAISAGLDINWRPDYFPRKVKDVDGFLSYIHGIPEWSYFEQSIREAGLDGATAEEQAEFLNKYLRGFVKVDIMPNKYGSEKERTIDVIDNELNQFYAPSMESLVGYIEGLNSRIVSSKYLGKGENIDESIGGYLTYLLNNNIIEPAQIDEVRDILRARFGQRGVSNRWLANARNYSYMYTMGGINSAITQIEDLSVAMYKAGVWNTITTAFESKRVTRSDLGLNSVSAEFVEQSKSGEALNKLFKLTGLDAIDGFGKETLINAELKKFRKMSDNTLREYLEPIMEDETQATIEDIRNNNISDNVLYLMFSELSDVQPISLSELPEFYNRSGNLRILYMLKSFAIKRIDIFRNECIDKIKSRDFEQRKEGLQNLFKLSILMIFCGASKDLIIDILYGRQFDLPETITNNILGLAGISKFQIYQAKEKGFTGTLKDMVVPPLFAFFDDLFTDTVKVAQGKRKLKDMEVLKGIPLVGRFYYWWIGRGREKQKKKKKY